MELALKGLTIIKLSNTKDNTKTAEIGREQLSCEINDCLEEIKRNELLFNFECDDDMIDAYIYQREALLCKYRSLIRRVKLSW